MGDLRFPLNVPTNLQNSMPWVTLTCYKWNFASVSNKNESAGAKRVPESNIPVISLYMPGGFSESQRATWGEEKAMSGDSADAVAVAKDQMGAKSGAKTTATMGAMSGTIAQPTEIMVYQRPDRPAISLNIDMVPRNEKESEVADRIAKLFKLLIMPSRNAPGKTPDPTNPNKTASQKVVDKAKDLAPSKAFLNFPPVWDISFSGIKTVGISLESNSTTNYNIYENMALEGVTVTYGGSESSVMTFSNGYPAKVSLQLQFKMINYGIGR